MTSVLKNSQPKKIKGAFTTLPIITMCLALVLLSIPLQHYVTLSRYQHYGLVIFIWGLGYILQVIWSWKRMLRWTRVSYLFGGFYITALGLFFYANPWLDIRMAIQTPEHDDLRLLARFIFCVLSLPLMIFWFTGWSEELRAQKSQPVSR